MPRPPMVAIVGRKHSGKTTLLVRLCAELHARGHRVMTIKHGSHTFNIDPSTTDTYRHYHEGNAERVVMVAPDKFALIERWSEELTPEEITDRYLGEADIVLCEGFKQSAIPKIEVYRKEAHSAPLYDENEGARVNRVAVVTDDGSLATSARIFMMNEGYLARLADFVEHDMIGRQS